MQKFVFEAKEVSVGTFVVLADTEEQAREQIESGEECFDVHRSELVELNKID